YKLYKFEKYFHNLKDVTSYTNFFYLVLLISNKPNKNTFIQHTNHTSLFKKFDTIFTFGIIKIILLKFLFELIPLSSFQKLNGKTHQYNSHVETDFTVTIGNVECLFCIAHFCFKSVIISKLNHFNVSLKNISLQIAQRRGKKFTNKSNALLCM
ncbi:hypothetical protein RFI_15201, partial [Reticulomyxa filosa]